jgi:hypothetical protein
MHCFTSGGRNDPCHLKNNNDSNDGIFKDPSLCFGDTFYLLDQPDTQGRDLAGPDEPGCGVFPEICQTV